ncbi:MAG: nucleotidyl transferase AbiEii/AbiGii toxin family protein [Myxococcaceae bacterium]
MAEAFLQLSSEDRNEALGVAAAASGRPTHLLEKDVWVVWALRAMFESEFGAHLVFKGGTSLSKAYRAIRRFSEDVDLTYDIRAIAPDLVGADVAEALPSTKSQEKKWTKQIRDRLEQWVAESALLLIRSRLQREQLDATASVDAESPEVLRIEYEHSASGSGYVQPVVLLEFGARSTGEPCDPMPVTCDAAEYLPTLTFPASAPRVMKAERTFWEKATAVHVFCVGGKLPGSRFSRHWYDLAQLDQAGHVDGALRRKDVATQVAQHKKMFFSVKAGNGETVDYAIAIAGGLRLLPTGPRLASLDEDYRQMIDDGLLLDGAKSFEEIIEACRRLEARVNAAMTSK